MLKTRTTIAVVGVLAASLALTACSTSSTTVGGGTSPSSSSSTRFNDADTSFSMDMIDHHQQAIDMAQMVLDKTGIDPRVTTLAQNIKAAQGPESSTMKSWLAGWGQKSDGMSDMDHGGMLMSDSDMAVLKAATGLAASRLFLEQMTTHHQGAIDMAKTERTKGTSPVAKALAQNIIDAQTVEITQMSGILTTL